MGCSGNCCQRFYLDYKPKEIDLWENKKDAPEHRDAMFIKDMLIYIEDYKDDTGNPNYKGAWYTCKHWDKSTKLCTVYEQRPSMCRDFPYGKKCQYDNKCDELGNTRTVLKQ
jgi:Fe-S-cluster containining protein